MLWIRKIQKENRNYLLIPVCVFLFLGEMWLFPEVKSTPKIKIMTTIFPLKEFAQEVSGKRGKVDLLLPPGAEIHTWQPRPSDIIALSSSDLFLYIGADLEPWVDDILKSIHNPKLKVLEIIKSLLKEESYFKNSPSSQKIDPHIWLDFKIDQMIVKKIASVLSQIEPESRALFKKNAQHYIRKLQNLHLKYKAGLKNCEHKTLFLGGHAAFGYWTKRYNLNQISLYGLNPNSAPTPQKLIKVVKLANKYNIEVIYFEINVSDSMAKVLAKEVGAKTMVLNPGASLNQNQLNAGVTFLDIMEKNLESLKNGLNCKQ